VYTVWGVCKRLQRVSDGCGGRGLVRTAAPLSGHAMPAGCDAGRVRQLPGYLADGGVVCGAEGWVPCPLVGGSGLYVVGGILDLQKACNEHLSVDPLFLPISHTIFGTCIIKGMILFASRDFYLLVVPR
jgi:hypothetical protein